MAAVEEPHVDEYRELICQHIPEFKNTDPSELVFTRFTAGLTNMVYACEDPDSKYGVVLRIFGSIGFGDRHLENQVCTLLGNVNVAPKIYYTTNDWRIEEFIRGEELNTIDFRDCPQAQQKSMELLADFHQTDATAIVSKDDIPWCVLTIEEEIAQVCTIKEQNETLYTGFPSVNELKVEIEWLHDQFLLLDENDSNLVFCHNDYRPANIIDADDGSLHAVDFDTVGYNYRGYDIGRALNSMFLNVTKEGCDWIGCGYPPAKMVNRLLVAYLTRFHDREPTNEELEALHKEVRIGNLAALLHLAIWSGLKSCHTDHDWNYTQYSKDRLQQYFTTKENYFSTPVPTTIVVSPLRQSTKFFYPVQIEM